LLQELRINLGIAVLITGTDLASFAEFADQAVIVHLGRVVETGMLVDLLAHPAHPYTSALAGNPPCVLGAKPRLDQPPSGCQFHPRCRFVQLDCRIEAPELRQVGPQHWAACHHMVS
jgi:peptide/nickel transport system ATP-binding protein